MPGSSIFTVEAYNKKRIEVLRKKSPWPRLCWAWLGPNKDGHPALEHAPLIQEQVEGYGEAILQSPDASDFRLVNIDAGENEFRIFHVCRWLSLSPWVRNQRAVNLLSVTGSNTLSSNEKDARHPTGDL